MPVIVEDRSAVVALLLVSLFLLGTWPAILTLLERRGRLPQHTYLDYSITNLLAAVVMAITLGKAGDTPSMPKFFTQLAQLQDNWSSVLFAMAGGIALALGNLLMQYAWAYLGLSVTTVIVASMVVVLGTTMNYFLDGCINRADFLFPGIGCFLTAALLGAAVHASNVKDDKEKLSKIENRGVEVSSDAAGNDIMVSDPEESDNGNGKDCRAICLGEVGTADFIIQVEERRSMKVFGSGELLGLVLVFLAAACFSIFSPAFNLATNNQWHTLKDGTPQLVVYTAFFYFSLSCFVLEVGLNIWFLYQPRAGVAASTIGAYVRDWDGRYWALLAGLLCGFGNGFKFMGGQAAGYAAADAVLALPLVSTVWAVVLFGEYRRSSRRTYMLLTAMLSMFGIALASLIASAGHRKAVMIGLVLLREDEAGYSISFISKIGRLLVSMPKFT